MPTPDSPHRARDADRTLLVVGLDVGGSKIAGGLVEFPAASILVSDVIPTPLEEGSAGVLAAARKVVSGLVSHPLAAGRSVNAIGIGFPELVDLYGQITSAQTIDWRDVDLPGAFGVPVRVEADVRAAALAEARYGAGKSFQQFVYVSIGTGISSTVVLDGRPHAGARGNALVLASSPLVTVCPACGIRSAITLEDVASGRGILAEYRRRGGAVPTTEEVLRRAETGEPTALDVVTTAADSLAGAVALLVNVLDPEAVILGGGLGLAGGNFVARLTKRARELIWAETSRTLPIVPAGLGASAGIIGAAEVALH